MFKKQEVRGDFKDVETVIGPSVKVKGNFNSKGNIIVEGIIEGNLKTSGNVFAGNDSKITANIDAKEVCINGEVSGNIKAKGHLKIGNTAKIFGDIECERLSIQDGAILNGKCQMNKGIKEEQKNKKDGQEK